MNFSSDLVHSHANVRDSSQVGVGKGYRTKFKWMVSYIPASALSVPIFLCIILCIYCIYCVILRFFYFPSMSSSVSQTIFQTWLKHFLRNISLSKTSKIAPGGLWSGPLTTRWRKWTKLSWSARAAGSGTGWRGWWRQRRLDGVKILENDDTV